MGRGDGDPDPELVHHDRDGIGAAADGLWIAAYAGTLIAPMFRLAGDRLGHRNVHARGLHGAGGNDDPEAALDVLDVLTPLAVLAVASVVGPVRLSDLAMRNALVAETMPIDRLMAAMGVARTTADSARVVGSLAGVGLFAVAGMAPAYVVITAFYATGFGLTLGVGAPARSGTTARLSVWRDLREGLAYVWDTPA